MSQTSKYIEITPTVRLAIGQDVTLQSFGDFATQQAKKAVAARGRETKPGWRDVGYYSHVGQAMRALFTRHSHLLLEREVVKVEDYAKVLSDFEAKVLGDGYWKKLEVAA